jgi:hypothetical protein
LHKYGSNEIRARIGESRAEHGTYGDKLQGTRSSDVQGSTAEGRRSFWFVRSHRTAARLTHGNGPHSRFKTKPNKRFCHAALQHRKGASIK